MMNKERFAATLQEHGIVVLSEDVEGSAEDSFIDEKENGYSLFAEIKLPEFLKFCITYSEWEENEFSSWFISYRTDQFGDEFCFEQDTLEACFEELKGFLQEKVNKTQKRLDSIQFLGKNKMVG